MLISGGIGAAPAYSVNLSVTNVTASGTIAFANGTAAAPSIKSNSSTSGFFIGTNNKDIGFSVAGVEVARFVGAASQTNRGMTLSGLLNQATGDEYAIDLAYTTNKATSGDDYGLRITQTDTASPGTSYLTWMGVGATSKFSVTNAGVGTFTSDVYTPRVFVNTISPYSGVGLSVTATGTASFGGAITSVGNITAGATAAPDAVIRAGSLYLYGATANIYLSAAPGGYGFQLASGYQVIWTDSSTSSTGTADTGLKRNAAGVIEVNSGTAGTLRDLVLRKIGILESGTTFFTYFQGGDQAADVTYTLPTALPASNMVLQSTSLGILSWVAAATVAGANTQVIFNDAGVYAGDAEFVYNKTTNTLTVTGPIYSNANANGVFGYNATNLMGLDGTNYNLNIQNTTLMQTSWVAGTGWVIKSPVADGASSIGFNLNTLYTQSTAGAKLLSVQNNTVEKAYIDKDGKPMFAVNSTGSTLATLGTTSPATTTTPYTWISMVAANGTTVYVPAWV